VSLSQSEYAVLRQTIASRGTTRMVLLPVTVIGWATVILISLLFSAPPVTATITLAVLVAGFEAIHALHVGVERIGRYLQVFYEDAPELPRWETTAMAVGPTLPGGGTDPLFSTVFVAASILNLIPAVLAGPVAAEQVVVGTLHAAFIVRIVRARGAAARQRAVELESYRALRGQPSAVSGQRSGS
jgi:hypothetical protein